MAHRNVRTRIRPKSYDPEFVDEVAQWVEANNDLIEALLTLRELGPDAAEAVAAATAMRSVVRLRVSMELWEALVEGAGDDAERLLLESLPFHTLDRLRRAVWGPSWDAPDRVPRLRMVRP
jgi:hypothetical protein